MAKHPSPRGLVSKALRDELLSWLEDCTPSEGALLKRLHILRAFHSSEAEGASCTLSYHQFLQYLRDQSLEGLFGGKTWSQKTFLKECSKLSTGLLQPACFRFGHKGYAVARVTHKSQDDLVVRLEFRRCRKEFRKIARGLEPHRFDDRDWLAALLNQTHKSNEESAQGVSAPSHGRYVGIPPVSHERKESGTYVPVVENTDVEEPRRKGVITPTPIVSEHHELTQMVFLVILPEELSSEQISRLLRPYHRACARIVERFGGKLHSDVDGRMTVYFGYGDSSEMHTRTAVQAAIQLAHFCQRIRRNPKVAVVHPNCLLLLHTQEAFLERHSADERHPTIVSASTIIAMKQLEKLACADEVVLSPQAHASVENFFECRPIYAVGKKPKTGIEKAVAYEVVREQNVPTLFDPTDADDIPLIGRDDQLRTLTNAWHSAKKGEPKVVWIRGMMGIGKSRLVHDFVSHVKSEPKRTPILLCQCWDCHEHTPLYPVTQMLMYQLGLSKQLSREQIEKKLRGFVEQFGMEAESIVPYLRKLVSDVGEEVAWDDGSDPGKRAFHGAEASAYRERTLEALLKLLMAMGEAGPVLLLVKDTHWADATTRELILHLLDHLALATKPLHILIVVSFRRWRGLRPRKEKEFQTFLELKPLEADSARNLVRHVARKEQNHLSGEEVESIVALAKGVPYLLRELAGGRAHATWFKKVMRESEADQVDDDSGCIGAKHVAQTAAVLGLGFTCRHLRAVLFGSPNIPTEQESSLRKRLDFLVDAEILRLDQPLPDARYRFAYDHIHACILNSISPQDLEEQHFKAAQIIEREFCEIVQSEPEILARHYTQAGTPGLEKAALWWHRTGEAAMNRSAYSEAVEALEKALKLANQLSKGALRTGIEFGVWLDLAEAWGVVRTSSDIRFAYAQAGQLAQEGEEASLAFRAQWGHWLLTYLQGNLEPARDIAEGLSMLPSCTNDPQYEREAYHAVWDTLFHLGHFQTAMAYHYRGMAIPGQIPREQHMRGLAGHSAQVCCLSRGALTLWFLGYVGQALEISQRAITLASGLEHPNSLAQANCHAALLHVLRQDPARAQAESERALEIADQHGLSQRLVMATVLRALAKLKEEPSHKTITNLERAISKWRATGVKLFETLWLGILAEACLKVNPIDRGIEVVREAISNADRMQERFYEPELYRINGELLLAEPRRKRAKAEECFRRSLVLARGMGARSLELRALVSLNQFMRTSRGREGDKREAHQMLKEAYEWFREDSPSLDLIRARELLHT